jgi:hypothetical protein
MTTFSSFQGLGTAQNTGYTFLSSSLYKISEQGLENLSHVKSFLTALTTQKEIDMSDSDSSYIEVLREHLH